MKRIEGRCLTAPPVSGAAASAGCAVLGPGGAVVGVGPVLLRTCSWGWAVSERVLVMV